MAQHPRPDLAEPDSRLAAWQAIIWLISILSLTWGESRSGARLLAARQQGDIRLPDAAAGSSDGDTVAELLAEVAELRERLGHATGQLSTKAEVIAALEQQLAWHRLPWWRRLIG